jgi:hypothetical protein
MRIYRGRWCEEFDEDVFNYPMESGKRDTAAFNKIKIKIKNQRGSQRCIEYTHKPWADTSASMGCASGYLNLLRLLIYKDFYAPPLFRGLLSPNR